MATVRVRIVNLTVRITLSVCPFNRMAHTANTHCILLGYSEKVRKVHFLLLLISRISSHSIVLI
jgi:hypothetical protein